MTTNFVVYSISVGPIDTNCYIYADTQSLEAFIIDPGDEADKIISLIKKNNLKPCAIINTHGHIDHISANAEVKKEFNIPVWIHKLDALFLSDNVANGADYLQAPHLSLKADLLFNDGDILKHGTLQLKVLHTPGHTPGGVCLISKEVMFSGDTLFKGTIGRFDFMYSNYGSLMNSIEKIKMLDPALKVYPGHGPSTTLQRELKTNAYLKNGMDYSRQL